MTILTSSKPAFKSPATNSSPGAVTLDDDDILCMTSCAIVRSLVYVSYFTAFLAPTVLVVLYPPSPALFLAYGIFEFVLFLTLILIVPALLSSIGASLLLRRASNACCCISVSCVSLQDWTKAPPSAVSLALADATISLVHEPDKKVQIQAEACMSVAGVNYGSYLCVQPIVICSTGDGLCCTIAHVCKSPDMTILEESADSSSLFPRFPLCSFHSQRLRVVLLLMLINCIMVSNRIILSMSQQCMVNETMLASPAQQLPRQSEEETASAGGGQCKYHNYTVAAAGAGARRCGREGTLMWSSHEVQTLLAAAFYGMFGTVWIVGPLIERVGPKITLAGALAVGSCATLASPLVAELSYTVFLILRVVLGMAEAFSMPAISAMATRWFPSGEKSTVVAVYTSGTQLATGLSSFFSAAICASVFFGGWPTVFYFFGSLGLVVLGAWLLLVTDEPAENSFITEKEKEYLGSTLIQRTKNGTTKAPLCTLFSNAAVLALLFCYFADGFSAGLMQSFLPLYLGEHLWLPIELNGMFVMATYIPLMISKLVLGPLLDIGIRRRFMTQTFAVRFSQGISGFGAGTAFIGLALLPTCQIPEYALGLLIFYGITLAACSGGYFTSVLFIAPSMTATIAGFGGLCTMLGYVFATSGVMALTRLELHNKWLVVFLSSAALLILAAFAFVFFGSGEEQNLTRRPTVADSSSFSSSSNAAPASSSALSRLSSSVKSSAKRPSAIFTVSRSYKNLEEEEAEDTAA